MLRIWSVLLLVVAPLCAVADPLPDDISKPIARLERIYGRGLMLGLIRGQPKLVDQLVKANKCTRTELAEQTPAFEQAGAEVAQQVVDAVGVEIEKGQTTVVSTLVANMKERPFPLVLAYVPVAKLLSKRVRFEAQRATDQAALAQAAADLDAFVAEQSRVKRDPAAWANSFMKSMGVEKLWDAFAGQLLWAYTDVKTASQGARIDVNKATAADLAALPGIGTALAERIVAARTQAGGFDSLDDLTAIPGVGPATFASLRTAAAVGEVVHAVKDWTVLVYTACANNREWKGVHELNLMETVGSSDQVNCVVQLARIDGADIEDKDMPDERSSGNWAGVRRLYVTRGKDPKNIESRRLASLGNVDMGSEKTLGEFFAWGIRHYPARHYCLVVRNHGGGSTWGIASDDLHHSHISTAGLGRALEVARDAARTASGDGNRKIDLVCLQACLMGMIEIGWEMKDSVQFMLASEALSPGCFAWNYLLKDLVAKPAMDPRELASSMVNLRMEDVQRMNGKTGQTKFTLAAYDLAKLDDLAGALDRLGNAVTQHWASASAGFTGAVKGAWKFDDNSRDIGDLCRSLAGHGEPEVAAAARSALDALGYLDSASEQAHVRIESDKPGSVIWAVNGWKSAPMAIRPAGSKPYFVGDMLETPLTGPDANGKYAMELVPFHAGEVGVRSVDYKLVGPKGGVGPDRHIEDIGVMREARFVSAFGPRSPLVAETHNAGHARATGLAMVAVDPTDAKSEARIKAPLAELKWANNGFGKLVIGLLDGTLVPAAAQ